jgi:hypothetical protein
MEKSFSENQNDSSLESNSITFSFEKFGDVSPEQELQVKKYFEQASTSLVKEWQPEESISVQIWIMSDEKFREGSKKDDPASWKYCFLMYDPRDNRIYINVAILSVLPDEASKMIKHELAHVTINGIIGDENYRISYINSYPLHEGFAGFENATELLLQKIKREGIKSIPDPLSIDSMERLKQFGADTNKEPFNHQLGYLVLFSFAQFLKEKYGTKKITQIYKNLDKETLSKGFKKICGCDLENEVKEWKIFITNLLK